MGSTSLMIAVLIPGLGAAGCSSSSGGPETGSGGATLGGGGALGTFGGIFGGSSSPVGGKTGSTGTLGAGGTRSLAGTPGGGAFSGGATTGGAGLSGTGGAQPSGGSGTGGTGAAGGAGGSSGSGGTGGLTVIVPPSGCEEPNKTICSNQVNRHCGHTYEFWRDSGGGCMVATADGFSMEWSEDNNVLARKGVRPGTGNEVFTYDAIYTVDGTSFLGIYGWTRNPLVEYYIVDSWGGPRPPGSRGEQLGSVESDGGIYDIYRTQQVDKPSIEQGVTTFAQYWSVLRSKRSGGIITVRSHFDAWQSKGMKMGSFYEVSLVVEGYRSSGSGDVRMSVK